jgi:phosphonate transport system permease protein
MSRVRELHRARPRDRFVRASGVAALALMVTSWTFGGLVNADTWAPRRLENLRRFLGELVPYPLQDRPWSWTEAASWAAERWHDHLAEATVATLAISVAAIALASACALILAPWAARTFARPDPFLPSPRPAGRPVRIAWMAARLTCRGLLAFIRSVPEYVWAFLLLGLYGPSAWPLVLALALHNAGVLGKLTADVVENLEGPTLSALRGLGAGRWQIALAGIAPLSFGRFLLFTFYRWETCVREATVLGMLGMGSLGFCIQDARARNHYDEMALAMACGAALVILGDLVSAAAREVVRRS